MPDVHGYVYSTPDREPDREVAADIGDLRLNAREQQELVDLAEVAGRNFGTRQPVCGLIPDGGEFADALLVVVDLDANPITITLYEDGNA